VRSQDGPVGGTPPQAINFEAARTMRVTARSGDFSLAQV
jgi:hypothetical protein